MTPEELSAHLHSSVHAAVSVGQLALEMAEVPAHHGSHALKKRLGWHAESVRVAANSRTVCRRHLRIRSG